MRLVQETYHGRRGVEALTYLYEPDSYVPLARIDRAAPAANDASAGASRDAVYYFHNDVSGMPDGNRGREKSMYDLQRNGYKVVAEEVTMKVNGKRIRADFVATDGQGNYHVFEAKHGLGRLTQNQKASGVFDMSSPSNTVDGIGGGVITPSAGTAGSFDVATGNKNITDLLGMRGTSYDAIFHALKY
jgi:hypothetical protein